MAARVAYVVSRFPKLSETFILDEILALRRRGLAIDLYALVEEHAAVTHSEARGLAEDFEAGSRSLLANLAAFLRWLPARPLVLVGLLALVVRDTAHAPRILIRSLVALLAGCRFARRMQRDGVTHVHAHWATYPAWIALVVRRLTGIPYSFTVHADDLFVTQWLLEEKIREASRVVTISEYNARFLRDHHPEAALGKIEVVHCGVQVEAFTPPARDAAPAGDRPLRILCVGRLETKKGHAVLVDACRALSDRGIGFECALVGDGSLRVEIEARIAERGLAGRMRCLGALERDRVRELLADADVFALPCVIGRDGRRDGIPVALMEAMAMELPVVATNVSGVPELVEDGASGWLVDAGDVKRLADALEAAAADPGRRRAFGRAGRARVVRDFNVEHNADRMLQILAPAGSA